MTQRSLLQYWSQLGRCSSYCPHRQHHQHCEDYDDGDVDGDDDDYDNDYHHHNDHEDDGWVNLVLQLMGRQ